MKRTYSVNPQASFARMSIEQIAEERLTEYLFDKFKKMGINVGASVKELSAPQQQGHRLKIGNRRK